MNYFEHYFRLMDRAQGRTLIGYVERHHVLPRCLGGSDAVENVVALTAEEHYVAHQLLVKMYPGNTKLLWALFSMTGGNTRQVRNNRMYGWVRRLHAAAMSVAGKKRTHSPETRAKIAAAMLGKRRGPHSAETKAKMSAASKGRVFTEEHRAAMSSAKLGKKRSSHTAETRRKMSESNKRAAETRDESYKRDPAYRAQQRENMLRIWAERTAQKQG